MIQDIGIVDTKKIINIIKEKYNYDYKEYAQTSLKRRLILYINSNNYNNINDFIHRLEENKKAFDDFYEETFIEETEMFRDPSLWRELRDKYLSGYIGNRDLKIWIAGATSGDEIFTLAIILKEMKVLDRVKIYVSCGSEKRIEKIKAGGIYDIKKIEISEANYVRFSGKYSFQDYYTINNNKAYMKEELLKNVEFKFHNIINEDTFSSFKVIFCRNQMIYLNPNLTEHVANKIVNSLMVGGILIIGSKETFGGYAIEKKLNLVNKIEKIYKKRID
ncbi:MAG: hypothetical protein KAT68_03125 [Bacteroidales bacterium]|nr:hypothetical protein [Bacteroidales bacterium]